MVSFKVTHKENGIVKSYHFETFSAAAGQADALSRDGILPCIHATVDNISGVMYRYTGPATRIRGCDKIINLVLRELNNVSN